MTWLPPGRVALSVGCEDKGWGQRPESDMRLVSATSNFLQRLPIPFFEFTSS